VQQSESTCQKHQEGCSLRTQDAESTSTWEKSHLTLVSMLVASVGSCSRRREGCVGWASVRQCTGPGSAQVQDGKYQNNLFFSKRKTNLADLQSSSVKKKKKLKIFV